MSEVNECPFCGSQAKLQKELTDVAVGLRTATVECESFRCLNCGEEFVEDWQIEEAQKRASSKIRREEDLLLPQAIKHIREEYLGLNQKEFETLLGVGPKTVTRWENGTVFQNSATDNLLRLVGNVPEAVWFLADRNGVELKGSFARDNVLWADHFLAGIKVQKMRRRTASEGALVWFDMQGQERDLRHAFEKDAPPSPSAHEDEPRVT